MEKKEAKTKERKRKTGFAGDEELQYADVLLKDLAASGTEEKYRKSLMQIRKAIRLYRRKERRRKRIVVSVVLLLILILIIESVCLVRKGSGTKNTQQIKNSQDSVTEPETDELDAKGDTGEIGDTDQAKAVPLASERTEILMNFTGDCILGTDEYFMWDTGFNAYYESNGGEYFFRNVKSIFEQDDLTVVNMEGTLTEETAREAKQFAFKGDPEFVDVLTNGSVEAANMANNHSHDYGEKSFQDTLDILKANDIATFGYDETAMLTVKGVNIGFFGIYELDDHLERIPQVKENIAKLKEEGADLIIAVFHWGNELETVPDSNEITLGHLAVDEGADLVIGHHPHILQGVETYHGKTIAYSLGNFCFGGNTNPTEMDTAIFQQKFVLDSNRQMIENEYTLIPCSVSSELYFNNYQPTPLTGDEAERVMQKIQERSDAIPQQEI